MKTKALITVLLVALTLVSCAPMATPVPTATWTLTPSLTPTSTLTPTPVTYIQGLQSINVPVPDDAFIGRVKEDYYYAMGLTRDQAALTYIEHEDINGQPFVVMVDNTTGVPLGVYLNGAWQIATLKFFGEQNGIVMGTYTFPLPQDLGTVSPLVSSYFEQFSRITVGTPWNIEEPVQGKIDKVEFLLLVPMTIQFAQQQYEINDYVVHALMFPLEYPDWLRAGNFTKDELRVFMRQRIEYVMSHSPEAKTFVVVNEPYLYDNYRQEYDIFYKAWGNNYDYITEAFEIAREVRPDAKLIYNDSDNHYYIGATSSISRQIASMLNEKGLIDYVGMQMHIGEWTKGAFDELMLPNMGNEIAFYKKMGVPVLITELTYTPSDEEMSLSPQDFNQRLTHVFGNIVRIAVESDNVRGITFWGVTDKPMKSDNWYQIFDENGKPKQSFYEVLKVLYEGMQN